MGSFSELVLSFDFKGTTPDEVLAAFSGMAVPLAADARWGPAPPLPPPVAESLPEWSPDYSVAGWGEPDPHAAEPWLHDWEPWFAKSMSVSTVPSAALTWSAMKRWNFSCRTSFKSSAEGVLSFLSWLGPFVEDPPDRCPTLLGYVQVERERPHLLWCGQGELFLESPPDPDDGEDEMSKYWATPRATPAQIRALTQPRLGFH